ncbi:MAG: hypothetical protein FWG79_06350 [Bacteroidales bacterium]|nr:hypothetical protein [Bacteroidales bacterium]
MKNIKHKNISSTESKILTTFMDKDKTWFTLLEAYSCFSELSKTAIRFHLKNMTDGGLLMRIREGVYYIIPYEHDARTYMPDRHLLAEPLVGGDYYIGYYSALQIHSLITQPSLVEKIVVNKQIKPSSIKIKKARFQYIYHNEKHFFGYEKTWIDNFNKVYCSDLEKTFIDCLFKPDYGDGIVEIGKALYFAQKNIDFEKLMKYIDRFESVAVVKRLGYLLELLEIENPIIEALQEKTTKSVVLLDTSLPKQGKINSRWSIQQNADIETIKNAIYT